MNYNPLHKAFVPAHEKGAGEWKVFNAVTHDQTSLLHSRTSYTPKKRKETAISFGASRLFVLKRA